ncbi:MAG TPA: GNAT family N-acetyltransferase [Gaiellaceae bacterium]
MTVLETERLVLRRLRPEDGEAFDRWAADDEFQRHLGPRRPGREHIARHEAHWEAHGFGTLGVVWRATGKLVGRCGVQYHRAWPDDPEVGWSVDPDWWGRGIATEAGRAAIDWAFGDLGYERVVSITTEENVPSRRVMEKLGFRLLTTLDWEEWHLWIHARDRPRP